MSPTERPVAPLGGRTVLLTRDGGLADEVRALGARVRVVPVVRYAPVPADADVSGFDWIVYTSPRAVAYSPFPPDAGPRVAVVGPGTARAVEARGGRVAFAPSRPDAGTLASELFREEGMDGAKVLFPCSDRALDTVPRELSAAGAVVDRRIVYRVEDAEPLPAGVADGADVLVFLAPSAVDAFARLGGDLTAAPALAIGPTTAGALRDRGVVPEVAARSDRAGLVRALVERNWE